MIDLGSRHNSLFFIILFTQLFFCNFLSAHAQQFGDKDSLQLKMLLYAQAHPEAQLFVQTDKTVYTNNETIWLCAYLMKSEGVEISKHQFISVALVNEYTRKVVQQKKYIMTNSGIALGSLLLPSNIPPSEYRLLVFTNLLDSANNPVACFTQPLTIKSITQRSFYTHLQLLDSMPDQHGALRVRLSWVPKPATKINRKVKSIVEYSIGNFQSKPIKSDSNSYIIKVTKEQLQQSNTALHTAVQYNLETQWMNLLLPRQAVDSCQIRFFPEGGYLVHGLLSTVGWETRSSNNQPLAAKAVLYKDGIAIDTISTSREGMGKFSLRPDQHSAYSVKILSSSLKDDKEYRLPEVLDQGIVMQVQDAAVNDSLRINFYSNKVQRFRILIHNYKTVFVSTDIKITTAGIKAVIPLQGIPKGIATITILDSNNNPIAERLFFAWFDKRQQEILSSDKSVYEKREKATITFKVKDLAGKPLRGLVSVAVVQENRVDYNKEQDIATYCYLTSELGQLQKAAAGRILDDRDHLNDLLLVKGWRRFSWQHIQDVKAKNKKLLYSPAFTAEVTLNNRPPRRSLNMTLLKEGKIEVDSTDKNGILVMSPAQLAMSENLKMYLFVNEKKGDAYSIEQKDPFNEVNKHVALMDWYPLPGVRRKQSNSREQELEGMQQAKVLQEVVVTSNNKKNIYGANACGDYVCIFNILNCPFHPGDPGNTPPVKGNQYVSLANGNVVLDGTNERVIYTGCVIEEDKKRLNGIYYARDFYGVRVDITTIAEPQYLSTLHWAPARLLNENGELETSFYTGDITGRFRVIVQGVSNKDLIVTETMFLVK